MERLNREASDWIFRGMNTSRISLFHVLEKQTLTRPTSENNQNTRPDEVDLHGLFVKEAIQRTEQAIAQAEVRGDSQMRIIVGKGLHSEGSVAKIKPAIEDWMVRYVCHRIR